MNKLFTLFILINLLGCTNYESIGPTKVSAATPHMFNTCLTRCQKLDKKLDKINLLQTYGTYSWGGGSYCSINIECVCSPKDYKDTESDSIIIPMEGFLSISNTNVGIFGANELCKRL